MKNFLLDLSTSEPMRRRVSRSRIAWGMAQRFVAGTDRDQAIETARRLHDTGLDTTLDFLGETVATLDEAEAARDEYLALLDALKASGTPSHVSLKPSQLGLSISPDSCLANVRAIVAKAHEIETFVRVDMEDSSLTQATLDLYRSLLDEFSSVGIVIQSYLYRSEKDILALSQTAPSVRLCKGAYREPESVAFPKKSDVDANYIQLTKQMMAAAAKTDSFWPAIASHDDAMIVAAKAAAEKAGLRKDQFEFQMLFGIRRDLQTKLKQEGHRMRVYLPYGSHWYPYLMRRMAERPANLLFVLRNLFR